MTENSYYHECQIDPSGKVVLPKGWSRRVDLTAGVVILPHLPSPLPDYMPADVWPNTDAYEDHLEEIDTLYYSRASRSRELLRVVYGSISYEAVDDDGSVLVKGAVRDIARLEGSIICVELVDHLELWNQDRWMDRVRLFDRLLTDLLT